MTGLEYVGNDINRIINDIGFIIALYLQPKVDVLSMLSPSKKINTIIESIIKQAI
ncbi:hypothetical protein [Marinicellulosiphila megalodicopiae]|uniref:hypothetical protein n=1 Tax=Marinicellulosiphila megalodicopiae TaxID=2724896 RepID=UPI003BB08340